MERDRMVKKKRYPVSAQLDEYYYRALKESKYCTADAVKFFVDNVINAGKQDSAELHKVECYLKEIETEREVFLNKREELKKRVGIEEINGVEISPNTSKNLMFVIRSFNNDSLSYHDFEAFIEAKNNLVESKALESNMVKSEFIYLLKEKFKQLSEN